MNKRGARVASIAVALLVAVLAGTSGASAMCVPGRIGVDPKTHKVYLELPRCDPPPTTGR